MNEKQTATSRSASSRRKFLRSSATAAAAGAVAADLTLGYGYHVGSDDTIKIGLVGCGGRGTGAVRDALGNAKGPVKLTAVGDVFPDRIERSLATLEKIQALRGRIDVPSEHKFVGFDAYLKVIEAVDIVLLTTPPFFRPEHYAAAVKAGKHIFMEKPCCVDAHGYRSLLVTNEEAKKKRLSVGVGFQRHHQSSYREGIKRIRDGAVGQIYLIRTYFNMPSRGHSDDRRPANMSEMEYQIRHWGMFAWLSGDHIVEQACHEIDIGNWIIDAHPIRANGMGGRQVRTGSGNGDIWDHHFVEYEYANGVRHFAQARQIGGCWVHISDNVHGSKGNATLGSGPYGLGDNVWSADQATRDKKHREDPYEQEHADLQASVRGIGPYLFEGGYGATSSMTAVLGRMATYSGKVVTWDEAVKTELRQAPKRLALDADPPTKADKNGNYAIAMPGITTVV